MVVGARVARGAGSAGISNPFIIVGFIILVAFSFLVSLAVSVGIYGPPIILTIGILYYQLRSSLPPTLTADEAKELNNAEEEQGAVAGCLWEVENEALRFDVKVNSDGTYHRGSKLGVSLNRRTEEVNEVWSLQQERITEILGRVENGVHFASIRFAFRWTIAAYFVILFGLFLIRPTWLEGVSAFVGQHVLARGLEVDFALYGAALAAGISAIVLLCLTYALRRASLRAKTGEEIRRLKGLQSWQPEAGEAPTDEDDGSDSYEDDDIDEMSDRNGRNKEDTGTCYEALGVPPTATKAEIEAAFHVKIKATHPDRVAGLDPELQALADQKTKRLYAAREEALRRL
jgi:DnaJ-domain-containing protein 1